MQDRLRPGIWHRRAARTRGSESEDPILALARSAGPREFMIRLMNESPHLVSNAQTLLLAAGEVLTRLVPNANKRLIEFRMRCFGLQLQVAS